MFPALKKHLQEQAIAWLLSPLALLPPAASLLWGEALGKWLQLLSPQLLSFLLVSLLALCIGLCTFIYLKHSKFIEYRGAFFKRKSGGGLHQAVYCGTCKNSTTTVSGVPYTDEPFICKCGWRSSFLLKEFNDFYPNLKS